MNHASFNFFISDHKLGSHCFFISEMLNLPVPCNSESSTEIKIKTLKGIHKTFCGTTKKCENKNLTYFFLFVRDWDGLKFT